MFFNVSVGGHQIKKVIISIAAIGTTVILGAIVLSWYRWKVGQKGKKMRLLHICVTLVWLSLFHTHTDTTRQTFSEEIVG